MNTRCYRCLLRMSCERYQRAKGTETIKDCEQYHSVPRPEPHRRLMSAVLERPLDKREFVHHINGIHADNRLDNLFICSPAEHSRIHRFMEKGISRADAILSIMDHRYSVPFLDAPFLQAAIKKHAMGRGKSGRTGQTTGVKGKGVIDAPVRLKAKQGDRAEGGPGDPPMAQERRCT